MIFPFIPFSAYKKFNFWRRLIRQILPYFFLLLGIGFAMWRLSPIPFLGNPRCLCHKYKAAEISLRFINLRKLGRCQPTHIRTLAHVKHNQFLKEHLLPEIKKFLRKGKYMVLLMIVNQLMGWSETSRSLYTQKLELS